MASPRLQPWLILSAVAAVSAGMGGFTIGRQPRSERFLESDIIASHGPTIWGCRSNPHPHFVGMWKRQARRHGQRKHGKLSAKARGKVKR